MKPFINSKDYMDPLQKLISLEKEARDFGFEWPHTDMILDQVISECEEIREAIKQDEPLHRIRDEIGDLLFSVISLCTFTHSDIESTLEVVTKKFETRLRCLKEIAQERGYDTLKGQDIKVLLDLGQQAKSSASKRSKGC